MTYVLFVLGFVLLIKGADFLINGAVSISKSLKISNIVIGLTVVAFGTSAPELIVNIFASISGRNEIAFGNIIGSNIANIFLILGIAAIIYPLKVKKNTVWREIPFSLLAAVVILIMANDVIIDGYKYDEISKTDGLTLLGFFSVFMAYIIAVARDSHMEITEEYKKMSVAKSVLFVIIGIAALTLGGKWIVDGAVFISNTLGLSQSFVGLTIIAVGTSLPELATSIVAAIKKENDIAIGNVVGSNIFNIFWILGLTSVIKPLPLTSGNNLDILMAIFASFMLFLSIFIFRSHMVGRAEGFLFVLIYITYIAYKAFNM